MHALEVLAEVAPVTSPRAVELCDWLDAHTGPDGGLPFACAITDEAGCAPWWRNPDTTTSSLHMTAQVAANAQLVARHDEAVRTHPWLGKATRWCLDAIASLPAAPTAYELLFSVRFLDALDDLGAAAGDDAARAAGLLERMGTYLPAGGLVPVEGGVDGEYLRPLDFAPDAKSAAVALFSDDVIRREVDRLAGEQQPDGGWTVAFPSSSPAAALEWRAYATLEALGRLRHHSVL
jgi:hypothetical protein